MTTLPKCKFRSLKGNTECAIDADTTYGFCLKHARTAQGTKAKKDYEINCNKIQLEEEKKLREQLEKDKYQLELEKKRLMHRSPKEEVYEEEDYEEEEEIPKPKKLTKNLAKVKPKKRCIKLKPNPWGRYEDSSTGFVFDQNTKKVYGKQLITGKVAALTEEDKELCDTKGYRYMSD
ncbi:MAG TPA: hypothetical protein VLE02_01885 [Nitrosarchaeum sp.]|nr:hypothetical protein [Nitrosarchaeum sp.]